MPHIGGKRPRSSGTQRITRLLVCLALGALATGLSSFLVPAATASPGETVAGTYTETVNVANVTVWYAGRNVIAEFTADVVLMGGFTGFGTSVGQQIFHPNGVLTVQAIVRCGCTVNDQIYHDSELVLSFTAIGDYLEPTKDGQFEVSGTGNLAHLHGHGTFHQGVLAGMYEAVIRFDSEK